MKMGDQFKLMFELQALQDFSKPSSTSNSFSKENNVFQEVLDSTMQRMTSANSALGSSLLTLPNSMPQASMLGSSFQQYTDARTVKNIALQRDNTTITVHLYILRHAFNMLLLYLS